MQSNLEIDVQKIDKEEIRISNEISIIEKNINIAKSIGGGLIILGLVIGIGGLFYQVSNGEFKLHELGDFIGGTVASLWALSGLFYIYMAFLGQQKQMSYQNLELQFSRFELKATRLELSGQREQMIEQNQSIKLQNFENTFFNLLMIFNQVVNNIDLEEQKVTSKKLKDKVMVMGGRNNNSYETTTQYLMIKGKDCFKRFYEIFRALYSKNMKNKSSDYDNIIKITHNQFFKLHETDLRHYYKNLIQLFKFIENSEIEDKKIYFDIVRAQLSAEEIYLLFYSCYVGLNELDYTNYIIKYDFLRNISKEDLIERSHFKIYEEQFLN